MLLEVWVPCPRCDGTGEMGDYGVKRVCVECSTNQPGRQRWPGYVPKLMPIPEVLFQAKVTEKQVK